ncbi:MAG: hypothetical protein ACK56I_08175, partial [bacterium]
MQRPGVATARRRHGSVTVRAAARARRRSSTTTSRPLAMIRAAPAKTWLPAHSRQITQPPAMASGSSRYWKGATTANGAMRTARSRNHCAASRSTASRKQRARSVAPGGVQTSAAAAPRPTSRPVFMNSRIAASDSLRVRTRVRVCA